MGCTHEDSPMTITIRIGMKQSYLSIHRSVSGQILHIYHFIKCNGPAKRLSKKSLRDSRPGVAHSGALDVGS